MHLRKERLIFRNNGFTVNEHIKITVFCDATTIKLLLSHSTPNISFRENHGAHKNTTL
jgi:hypothetical protein